MRFIFCVIIVLRHSEDLIGYPYPFLGGALAVEFFFLVSGYLMAKSVEKMRPFTAGSNLGRETARFIGKKISSLLPEYIVAWIIAFAFFGYANKCNLLELYQAFCTTVGELFFLKMAGMSDGGINGVVWYISTMLICMTIIFPLLRKYRNMMLYVIIPLSCALILGGLYQNGSLRDPTNWCGFFFKGNLRGFAEIELGIMLFYAVENLKAKNLNSFARTCIMLLKWGAFALFINYICYIDESQRDYAYLFVLVIFVGLIFSRQAIDSDVFDRKICFWLGKFSLPLYLSHIYYAFYLSLVLPEGLSVNEQLVIYLACAFITALFVMLVSKCLRKNKDRIKCDIKKLTIKES